MASGDIGQDELMETLENIFKMISKKRNVSNQKDKEKRNLTSQMRNSKEIDDKVNKSLDQQDFEISSDADYEKDKIKILPEDRLTKDEAYKSLHSYAKSLALEDFSLKSEFLNDDVITLKFIEKGTSSYPESRTLSFDLETGLGEFEKTFTMESNGRFVPETALEKSFNEQDLRKHYFSENQKSSDILSEKNLDKKVVLVDSMSDYAKTLELQNYNFSSKSLTKKKAIFFFKHKDKLGDVMQLSYNPESEKGQLVHLLSNKENSYSNEKKVVKEFFKEDLERHGYGKNLEEFKSLKEKERLDTLDTSDSYYEKVVYQSSLGKSVADQLLNNPEMLKNAVALYQLTSMRKLLSNSKDQIQNLNSLLNKNDVNFEKISAVKDSLSNQIDVLQAKVTELEKNQETSKTFDKLNEEYKKDRDEDYEKNIENQSTRIVEVEHSM